MSLNSATLCHAQWQSTKAVLHNRRARVTVEVTDALKPIIVALQSNESQGIRKNLYKMDEESANGDLVSGKRTQPKNHWNVTRCSSNSCTTDALTF
jgi:hypothetical protein